MDFNLIASNLLSPPILFFFLGILACLLRSDLEIPQPLPKFFSLYLLLSIGFKGGAELHKSGFTPEIAWTLGAGILMAVFVPAWTFLVLRRKLDVPNAAAVASAYGSVSAVTFIAASALLSQLEIHFGGHMIAALAVMESPAIVIGVALVRWFDATEGNEARNISWKRLLHDAFANGSVFLLCGALLIGMTTGIAAFIARWIGIGPGDAFLFVTLCASASYIAVPAAMRIAVPAANPGIYVTMSLALTFPFNIILGLPTYLAVIQNFWK